LLWPLAGRAAYPFIGQQQRKVSRDAYISFRGNRYSVPWSVAGQEVLLQEDGDKLWVQRGGERLAVHSLCTPGARQTVIIAAHHEGIPLSLVGATGKAKIVLQVGGTESSTSASHIVEVRPLWAYEQYAEPHGQPLSQPSQAEVRHR